VLSSARDDDCASVCFLKEKFKKSSMNWQYVCSSCFCVIAVFEERLLMTAIMIALSTDLMTTWTALARMN